MKLVLILMVNLLFAVSAYAQTSLPLDQKLPELFRQHFTEWKAESGENVFYPTSKHTWKVDFTSQSEETTGMRLEWTINKRRLLITFIMNSPEMLDHSLKMFLIRNITPPSRNIKNSSGEFALIQFYDRVEVAFIKNNLFSTISLNFPNKRRENPSNEYSAPAAEVETALKIAALIADNIFDDQAITLTDRN